MSEKIWAVGQGMSSREIPLDVKRRFAWVFASPSLPRCVECGAVVELRDEGDIFLKWRELSFKLASSSDMSALAEKLPYADFVIPQKFPEGEGELSFVSMDTKDTFGFICLLAAKRADIDKIYCFESSSAQIRLNPNEASKIEIIPNGTKIWGKIEGRVFVEISLSLAENPLELIEELKNPAVCGVSMINDCPPSEKELPQKAIEAAEAAGFKGTAFHKIFIGWKNTEEVLQNGRDSDSGEKSEPSDGGVV